MVGAGTGVTLIPEMAAAVETRSASVSGSLQECPTFANHRDDLAEDKSSGGQLLQVSEAVCAAPDTLRKAHRGNRRDPRTSWSSGRCRAAVADRFRRRQSGFR